MKSYPRVLLPEAQEPSSSGKLVQKRFRWTLPKMAIREEVHAESITLDGLQERVENLWSNRNSSDATLKILAAKREILWDILHLQTLDSSVRSSPTKARGEVENFLEAIRDGKHAQWLQLEEARNVTSISYAFVCLLYELLARAGMAVPEDDVEEEYKAATRRRHVVKGLSEKIEQILSAA